VKGQLDPSWHKYPDSGKTARSGTLDYRLVKGQLDPSWHKYPDSGKTARSGTLDYRLVVENTGNVSMTNVVVIDVLPFISDMRSLLTKNAIQNGNPN